MSDNMARPSLISMIPTASQVAIPASLVVTLASPIVIPAPPIVIPAKAGTHNAALRLPTPRSSAR